MIDPAAQSVAELVALVQDAVERAQATPEGRAELARIRREHREQRERLPADFDTLPWSRQRTLLLADALARENG